MEWADPRELLRLWSESRVRLCPPTRRALIEIAAFAGTAPPPATKSSRPAQVPGPRLTGLPQLAQGLQGALDGRDPDHGLPEEVMPGVRVIPVRSPTLLPATHTNCVVFGTAHLAVVDPAAVDPEEIARLIAALETLAEQGAEPREVLLTHHHPDHVGSAAAVAQHFAIPISAHPWTAHFLRGSMTVGRTLNDGDRVQLDSGRWLDTHFTPGHAPGHLIYRDSLTGATMVGDLVAAVGTILIDPDEGHMGRYLDSLEYVRRLAPSLLIPSHGCEIGGIDTKLDQYRNHRLMREMKVWQALTAAGEPATPSQLVAVAYDDTPSFLHGLAERSLLAHLIKLAEDGRAQRIGDRFESVDNPPAPEAQARGITH